MTKTMLALATASTLTLSAALAQAPPSTPPSSPPAAAESSSTPIAAERGAISTQKPDEWLMSKQLKGMSVLGTDGTKLGSVDDVLMDRNGSVKALVIGVGGFLGIGAKEVALPFKQFQVVPGTDGKADVLTLSMTKEQLKDAEEFKAYEPPKPATSSPSGMTPGGASRAPMSTR